MSLGVGENCRLKYMAALLAQPQDCCRPCQSPLVENIPGAPGAAGESGAAGANGTNAWTTVTEPFVMPAELGDVTVTVADATWSAIGEPLFLGDPTGAAKGTFLIVGKPDGTHLTLRNPSVAADSIYPNNSAPGTIFPALTVVSPSGLQGPPGTDGTTGAPTTAKYITQEPTSPAGTLPNEQALSLLSTGLAKVTTATGVISTVPLATANTNVAPVDAAGGLVAGEALFGTASGIESKTAAASRTALGLGTMATQAASAVAITGGTIASTAISGAAGSFTTLAASAATTLAGTVFEPSSALQTVAAGNTLLPNARKIRVAGSGGPITLISTPTITNPVSDGQRLLIQGTDDTNTVTLQDSGTLAGSKLRLQSTSRVLGEGDNLELEWDQSLSSWFEVSFAVMV